MLPGLGPHDGHTQPACTLSHAERLLEDLIEIALDAHDDPFFRLGDHDDQALDLLPRVAPFALGPVRRPLLCGFIVFEARHVPEEPLDAPDLFEHPIGVEAADRDPVDRETLFQRGSRSGRTDADDVGAGGLLFDLDGTFADTAPDLAFALNETLRAWNRPELPYSQIRPVVSHGGIALIRLGFGMEPGDERFEDRRQFLLDVYKNNLCRHTTLFDGMSELLDNLEQRAIPWGIVTNKPAWLTDPLMEQLNLTARAACIVSGDTTENRKPHPQPILLACEIAGADPLESIYVGDAARDIEAGRSAGVTTLTARFGYIGEQDQTDQWGADGDIDHPLQILDWLAPRVTPG